MDEKNRPVDASGFEETEYEAQHFELDAEWQHASSSKAERALVRKLDWRLVPACWLINAKIGGLEEDFDLTSNQYSVIVLVFFVSYILAEVPSNMVLSRVKPHLFLPLLGVFGDWWQHAWVQHRTRLRLSFSEFCSILEGVASIVGAVVIFFVLPDFPSSTTRNGFLTEEERTLACNRLAAEGFGLTQGPQRKVGHWKAFKMVCADWRTWGLALLFVLNTGSQTMQYFIPCLVKSFGWRGKTAQFIFAFGPIYSCSALIKTWISHILGYPAEKRAVAIALINALGNASSIYGSFLWPKENGPQYLVGFGPTTA
ncbi:uncharacterized protein MYCGRDRAFT_94250 [Zymoseptoria tritici IPO323]|uniref:Major facilitator superfamily (MFS) profile domain-containing protein n=1 Tax=Zymoseptoria tritici (strain CBS 115943 / IPO323) TaxID=336722 RepID=F9XGH6_ZYMTI|nr:uncharacterized protein MYCGRDRAFT_94250 [Zymoseptoria tritici IPO323]EGP85563.1 hypothetical protein MYCGRDRAFT_94250 [Zymoseptoria tritici IPO323]